MIVDLIGALAAFLAGAGICYLNYLISKKVLTKYPQNFSFVTILRQLLQIGFIVIAYIIGSKTTLDTWYLLIGGVLGLTLPMFYFTKKLVKLNDIINKKETEAETDG